MAIFRREAGSPDPSPAAAAAARVRPVPAPRPGTCIAAGTRVVGEISGSTGVSIEGHFEGAVQIDSEVTVGQEGFAHGEITARAVRIAGKMLGDVRGTDLVEITSSGSLEGNIAAARVIIAEGAFFKGKVQMGKQEPAKEARPRESRSADAAGSPPAPSPPSREPSSREPSSREPSGPEARGSRS